LDTLAAIAGALGLKTANLMPDRTQGGG